MLEEIERDDTEIFLKNPEIFLPENANDQCDTDEYSGEQFENRAEVTVPEKIQENDLNDEEHFLVEN